MTPRELLDATQGRDSPVYRIKDTLRMMAIYVVGEAMVVGFGGTRPNLWDWLSNLDPEPEALGYLPAIREQIRIYQPRVVILAGHSQGGAIAETLGDRLGADEVVTFGGLPTRYGATVHYLRREDPMAWLPFMRKGAVRKLGANALVPDPAKHSPKAYAEALK